ncbi:MAG: hypothetical protein WA418_25455, partial [Bradyrhizobium sp.]
MAEETKETPSGGDIDGPTAARLLMCTEQWFLKLVKDGWIKRASRGRYRIVEVVQGHIRYLQDEGRRATKTASASRVQEARAAQIEMQTQRELGRLVDVDEVLTWQSEILGTLARELTGVPTAATRDLTVRAEIEKHLNGAVDRCRKQFEE